MLLFEKNLNLQSTLCSKKNEQIVDVKKYLITQSNHKKLNLVF